MLLNIEGYDPTQIQNMDLSDVTTEEINRCLKNLFRSLFKLFNQPVSEEIMSILSLKGF